MCKFLPLAVFGIVLSVNAQAGDWEYEVLDSDFGDSMKIASLKDDTNKFTLAVSPNKKDDGSIENNILIMLPKGYVTSSECSKICYAKINIDGNKELEPVKLLESNNFKNYYFYGQSQERFLQYLQKNKSIKIQLPLHRDLIGLTFTQDNVLDIGKLENAK